MNGTMVNSTLQAIVIKEEYEILSTNYMGLAAFTMLVYDHIITFADEIHCIWLSRKKPISWLFLLNRYLTPLAFIVNLNAYLSPAWSLMTCRQFVVYEGIMGFVGVAIASLMMLLRVRAIYDGEAYVAIILWTLYLIMFGVNVWLLTTTGPVIHRGLRGCTMLFGQSVNIGFWVSATAWTPLFFDTAVILLVVLRTWRSLRLKVTRHSKVIRVLIRDGIMYYSVIFAVNLVLAIMIVRAPDGIKNICAQLQLLLTVTMMSRITLSLRKNFYRRQYDSQIGMEVSDNRVQIQLRSLPRPPPKSVVNFTKRRFLSLRRYSTLESA